jgi:hypothetical protein
MSGTLKEKIEASLYSVKNYNNIIPKQRINKVKINKSNVTQFVKYNLHETVK